MKFPLRIVLLLFLVSGTLADIGFDLGDALDDDAAPTPPKPKEQPKVPENTGGGGLDLSDFFDNPAPTPAKEQPKVPDKPKDDGGFDLGDALGPDPNPKPDKPAVKPPPGGGGGGGSFDDSDLFDVGGGEYKPDGGRSGGRSGGGGAADPGYDPNSGSDQTQDPDLMWGQILKLLNANMPEEFYVWISNLKQTLTPLVERAMEMLQAVP
ncbi:CD99 molecule isoform X3 [Labrus bergylta]|uniref:CD99 molecule isoform X3 n=1 Tax=Labrus bergylta TaxID=56723 RepID=UPI0009B41CD2|nr:CD99 antigen-like protein 2 isoform X3 [Labrus bergylta]